MFRPFAALSAVSGLLLSLTAAAQDLPDPEQVVNHFEQLSGVHKGLRRNHAKGVCLQGEFTASKEAAKWSESALFSGKKVPAIGRFSLAGPNPLAPDAGKSARGFALQFQLPHDDLVQTAMLNIPVFAAATVTSFVEGIRANLPDPATGQRDPEKGKTYAATHPDAKAARDWITSHNPPPGYDRAVYYSLNAFKFVKGKKETWVKWRFVPKEGAAFMSDAEVAAAPRDFLDQALTDRARKGPILFDMIVTIGAKGDPIDNPAIAWPAERREFTAGTLSITKAGIDAAGACDDINFNPNVLSAGIEASPDQILAYRAPVYGESYSRRESEK